MPQSIRYGQQTETPTSERRVRAIKEAVVGNVGRPDDLLDIDVIRLWDSNHYRVNLYREVRSLRKLTDSYFICVVADGVVSSPPMTRKYNDDMLDDYMPVH